MTSPTPPNPEQTPPYAAAPPAYTPPPTYGAPATPPAYGAAPTYGAAPGYGYGYPEQKTNTLAIVSLVSSILAFVILPFVASVVGVITGHMALGQIKRTGEGGRGLALGGTIVGWVGIGLGVLGLIFFLVMMAVLLPQMSQYSGA